MTLILLLLSTFASYAAEKPSIVDEDYTIVGVNREWVAVRARTNFFDGGLASEESDDHGSMPCKYATGEGNGVSIHFYKLPPGKFVSPAAVKIFSIYETVSDAKKCTTEAAAKKSLNAAKAFARERGFELDAKLEGVELTAIEDEFKKVAETDQEVQAGDDPKPKAHKGSLKLPVANHVWKVNYDLHSSPAETESSPALRCGSCAGNILRFRGQLNFTSELGGAAGFVIERNISLDDRSLLKAYPTPTDLILVWNYREYRAQIPEIAFVRIPVR